MIYKTLLITFLLLFTACGDNTTDDNSLKLDSITILSDQNETNITLPKVSKSVTIYVHGYSSSGYNREGVYGEIDEDSLIDNLAALTNLPTMQNYDENSTNILAITLYYGDEAPAYYTQEDLEDIDTITNTYGGGIPRYATIIAKFAKHVMNVSGADNVNIVSGSMGSLVTRWLIEKDIEQLASQKKIKKWLSIEGVIHGNYAASITIPNQTNT